MKSGGLLRLTAIASAPAIENAKVLPSDLAFQQRKQRNVDIGRDAPHGLGIQRRLGAGMGYNA